MKIFLAITAAATFVTTTGQAKPKCDENVAYYSMVAYAKDRSLHSGNLPAIKPTDLKVYPNIHADGSTSYNDSMVYVATGDASGKEIVGYVEFDRKTCAIVPKMSGVIEGEDLPL